MPKSQIRPKPIPKGLPVAKKDHRWVQTGSVGDFYGIPSKKETTVVTPVERAQGRTKLGDKKDE